MPEITEFQRLYHKHYGKELTQEEAEKKRIALVNLLRICVEFASKK